MEKILREAYEAGFNEGQSKKVGVMCVLDFDEWYKDTNTQQRLGKLFAIPVVSEMLPTDEEIKRVMTTEHYSHDKGRYRKIRLDRIQGGKMIRDLIKKRLTGNVL